MQLNAELIHKKRDGGTLNEAEIRAFVQGVTSGSVTDAQIAAFAMAVWFQEMTRQEQRYLTLAMRDSGQILQWPDLDGPVLDKHSTGGVGDLVSLVLGPLIAACGVKVPMISGRGLGHTGGTVDKLESIPGFDVRLGIDRFQRLVRENGIAIVGQTRDLAPADRRIYAVRDVTATVASVPLIVASILSKKLAEGLDGLVIDIKTGSGAFMRELDDARRLAGEICRVASECGLPCTALISDMNQPLCRSVGSALEVREAIDFLLGLTRHDRLQAVVLAIATDMLTLGGLASDAAEAERMVNQALKTGRAAEVFARMVAAQGGPADLLERPEQHLPVAPLIRALNAERSGYVSNMDLRGIGMAVLNLGGGRRRAEDTIDASVGLSHLCGTGQSVEEGEPLAWIHAADEVGWRQAEQSVRSAISIGDRPAEANPVLYDSITGAKSID